MAAASGGGTTSSRRATGARSASGAGRTTAGSTLLPWTPSQAVRPGGEANELTVQATGSRLTFLVNGSVVARVDHPELTEGAVGVFVGGDLNEVVLERLVVQAPG